MNKEHFNDRESAEKHAERTGGNFHDNTHSSLGYRGNDYTVTEGEKGENALYSPGQLDYERSIGLDMSDSENENYFGGN